jgi:Retroviral aspartyl protease
MTTQPSRKGKEEEKPKGNPSQGQPKKPDLMDKLGKDGKLTQQECQRRQDNNLCLFCGQDGHRVRECPRSTAARAAKVPNGKAPEPKAEATATASKPKKIVSDPSASAHSEGCVDLGCAQIEVKINASTLSLSTSLVISLSTPSVPDIMFKSLVDSGSTHCFIESAFVRKHVLNTRPIVPIPLHLFDGSINASITEAIELPL